MFDSINPQLLESNVWTKFNFTKNFSAFVGAGFSLNGSSIANYWNVQGGIAYRMPSTAASSRAAKRSEVERFNEETSDGVDQTLFETSPAVKEVPKPAPKKRTAPAPKNIQNELDKTEMQIEMKTLKNKTKNIELESQ